jgi:hypothetical protein
VILVNLSGIRRAIGLKMSTVIRVKRKLNEEQAVDDKIVLNIKRQKTDEKITKKLSQNDEKTVLMFAGTVDQVS